MSRLTNKYSNSKYLISYITKSTKITIISGKLNPAEENDVNWSKILINKPNEKIKYESRLITHLFTN